MSSNLGKKTQKTTSEVADCYYLYVHLFSDIFSISSSKYYRSSFYSTSSLKLVYGWLLSNSSMDGYSRIRLWMANLEVVYGFCRPHNNWISVLYPHHIIADIHLIFVADIGRFLDLFLGIQVKYYPGIRSKIPVRHRPKTDLKPLIFKLLPNFNNFVNFDDCIGKFTWNSVRLHPVFF